MFYWDLISILDQAPIVLNIYITILLLYIGYSSSILAHCPAKEFAILSSIAVSYSQVWDMFSQK